MATSSHQEDPIAKGGDEPGGPACGNPMCTCSPCSCTDCHCGAAALGDLEGQVMEVLWGQAGQEMTARDVASSFPKLAYTTVATVLDRLHRKELVRRRLDGLVVQFSAVGSRAAHTALLMHQTLRTARDPGAALARFAEIMSPAEAEVLTDALQRVQRVR